jgi:uncharacterized radical SAM superfamily Fe-S cluster-containing enzyme
MRRTCTEHGYQETVLSTDARFYWLAKGDRSGGCCGGTCSPVSPEGKDGYTGQNAGATGGVAGKMEQLSTCLALIEIVRSCNLSCTTCFAEAPHGASGASLEYYPFDDIVGRVQSVIDRKGKIEILQFSGGEPTIHPDFLRLVEWAVRHPLIECLLINTNGLKFAAGGKFVERVGELFKEHRKIQLYLQFDGPQEEGQVALRGIDLRQTRLQAIGNCKMIGLPITLAMTVTRQNLGHVWAAIEFAREFEHIRGISFQPMFLSGRTPHSDTPAAYQQSITVADIVLGLHEQSNRLVCLDDFTPLPCGDPNCATISWLIRAGGIYIAPSRHGIDIAELQRQIPDRVNYKIEDLVRCGCEGTPLGDLMKKMEVTESHAFRIFLKPFMDAWTWDQDRIDRCCTHVIRPDGKLDSFCRYYANPPTVTA